MREPTALAFAGDWHANAAWAEQMISACERHGVDTIVHTGDYGFVFTQSFIDRVETACRNCGVMIYFVDGNHDNHDVLFSLPDSEQGFGVLSDHVRYVRRGQRWQWWGKTFMGLGGAHSVDRPWRVPMVSWWPTEFLNDDEIEYASRPGEVDVMIAHDVPSGITVPGISFEQGIQYFPEQELLNADAHRSLIRSVVDAVQPKVYVHGHYHVSYETTNQGCYYRGLDMDATSFKKNLWIVHNINDLEKA